MANLKSAIKRIQTNETRRSRNKSIISNMRTNIKRVEHFVNENDLENAKEAYQNANRIIDRAVQKGVIHKNNGNRQKARLAKKLRSLSV